MEITRRQTYVFPFDAGNGLGVWAWGELWMPGEERPRYAPTPFRSVDEAVGVIAARFPGDVVDSVTEGSDLVEMVAAARSAR